MSDLSDKLLEIKRQKDEYILPENLKKDVTVYGVTGTLDTTNSGGQSVQTIVFANPTGLAPKSPEQVNIDIGTFTGNSYNKTLETIYMTFPQIEIQDFTKVKTMIICPSFVTTEVSKPSTYYSIYDGDTLKCMIGRKLPTEDDYGGDVELGGIGEAERITFYIKVGDTQYSYTSSEYYAEDTEMFDLFGDSDYVEPTQLSYYSKYSNRFTFSNGITFKDASGNVVVYNDLPQYIKDMIRLYDYNYYRTSNIGGLDITSSYRPNTSTVFCSDLYVKAFIMTSKTSPGYRWFKLPYRELCKILSVYGKRDESSINLNMAIVRWEETPEVYNGVDVYTIKELYSGYDDLDDEWYMYGTSSGGYHAVLGRDGGSTKTYIKYTVENGAEFVTATTEETVNNAIVDRNKTPVGTETIWAVKNIDDISNVYFSYINYIVESSSSTSNKYNHNNGLPVRDNASESSSIWDDRNGYTIYGHLDSVYNL